MKMNGMVEKRSDTKKKPSYKKYTLAAVVVLLLITPIFVFMMLKSGTDPASEKVIREAAAAELRKDPNELTDDDFAKITTLFINGNNICNIQLLEKFINLKELVLIHGTTFKINDNTTKWKLFLTKIGIIKLPVPYCNPWELTIDIKPLAKLKHLQRLDLGGMKIKNINSLTRLSELKELSLWGTDITDIEPLGKLENLETLTLKDNIKKIITDLGPLKKLKHLQTFNYNGISEEQIDDLRKALPNLKLSKTKSGNESSLTIIPPE
jgi:Leucine-rich repeat (LRR) protein